MAQHDTTLVAGPLYGRGALHRMLFGSEYRQLWTAPVRARVLDLGTFAGGLTPTTAGGGFQTKSLRFRGADGFTYGFRSVDKDPSLLPPELDGTFLDDIVRDQTSSQHPGAPAVVAALLEAAGVLHGQPMLVVLPDDPRLDSFRTRFAGTLGYLERRTTGGNRFAGAREIVDSPDMIRRIFSDPAQSVDAHAFLRARLMDLFVGDWDRHRDQWDWALLGEGAAQRWQPIPGDRDHAFVRFDGLLPTVARNTSSPLLLEFGGEFSDLNGQVFNGRDLDRWLLGSLDQSAWDGVARDLQSRLTDSVLHAAAESLAPGWRELEAGRLERLMRERRDDLLDAARAFYRWLAREAEIHTTGAADDVTLERRAGGSLAVRITANGSPWYSRQFEPGETREVRLFLARPLDENDTADIRIYGMGARDRVTVTGDGPARITVRIVADSTTQLPAAGMAGVEVYPAVWRAAPAGVGPGSVVVHRVPSDSLELPPDRSWGSRRMPISWIGGGPDIGIFFGLGVSRTAYGFRKTPSASRWSARAGWATQAGQGRIAIEGQLRREQSSVRTEVRAWGSGIEVLRWHGLGNATADSADAAYHRVNRAEAGATVQLVLPLVNNMELGIGPSVLYSHTRVQAGRIIADSLPYGSDNFGMAGVRASLRWDTRDRHLGPTRGALLAIGGSAWPATWGLDSAFAEVHGQLSTYLTARNAPLRPTLALRAGAKQVFGGYPYAEAAFIGDAATVRLGRQNRYGGDKAAWAGSELRLALTRFRVLLPGELGVFGLAETGRVWVKGETSERWHAAVGGGVWISLVQPGNVFSIALAQSAERSAIYVLAGFAY